MRVTLMTRRHLWRTYRIARRLHRYGPPESGAQREQALSMAAQSRVLALEAAAMVEAPSRSEVRLADRAMQVAGELETWAKS